MMYLINKKINTKGKRTIENKAYRTLLAEAGE